MFALDKIDSDILVRTWQDYPETRFTFGELEFAVRTNPNLRSTKLLAEKTGIIQVRINPQVTWDSIKGTIQRHLDWCLEQQSRILKEFDPVTYRSQLRRQMTDNDVIYIWGQPYLLQIDPKKHEDDRLMVGVPVQLTPVLVPKGRSRYALKFSHLWHSGYLNRQALYNLPLINQGSFIMPKHSLWHDIENLNRYSYTSQSLFDARRQAHIDDKEQDAGEHRDLGNYYIDCFVRMQQLVWNNLRRAQFYGSRMLSEPRLELIEDMIRPLTSTLTPERLAVQNLGSVTDNAEMIVGNFWKALLNGAISDPQYQKLYPHDPFIECIPDTNQPADMDITTNINDKSLVRNLPPARLIWRQYPNSQERNVENLRAEAAGAFVGFFPDKIDFSQMTPEQRLQEIERQRNFYATGKINSSTGEEGLPLSELELTLFTPQGEEVDPARALLAILPDMPDTANYLNNMPVQMVESHAKDSFARMMARDILASRIPPDKSCYFHNTLANPGELILELTADYDQAFKTRALGDYLRWSLSRVATSFLSKIKRQYANTYIATSAKYRMPTISWYQEPIKVIRMNDLGQCRSHRRALPEIRLNLQLAHYPPNVMISVALHELCHLAFCNHSPAFRFMLNLFDPEADRVSDSIFDLGIIPLIK